MLINFKVRNFRSIKSEIILDLQASSDDTMSKQTVFEDGKKSLLKSIAVYGANASGKSNIFKAMIVFRIMILESLMRSSTPMELPNEYFKLDTKTLNKPSHFEMTFTIGGESFVYGFEIKKQEIHAEWLHQEKGKKILFDRKKQEITSNKNYFKEATAVLKKQTTEKVLFLTLLASNNGEISKKIVHFVQNINIIPGTDRGGTLDFSFGEFLKDANTAKEMKRMLTQADFGIVDIKASQKLISTEDIKNMPDKFKELLFKSESKITQRKLDFLHNKYSNGKLEGTEALDFFAEESEGTQQMFALSAPIIDTINNAKILFIDEIDASLHPILCQYLISIFNSKSKNKKNAQLIVSTHDISLLDDEIFRRDQIYFTEKTKEGETNLFSLMDISERKGVDFAKRYMEGRYNALPYIAEFENIKFDK